MFVYLNIARKVIGHGKLAFLNFFSYFILLNTMIPISLIVSLEMVKVVQAYFIANDACNVGEQTPFGGGG